MKLRWKKFLPQTLAVMLIASSPLSVLSTSAYASSINQEWEQSEQEVELLLWDGSQDSEEDKYEGDKILIDTSPPSENEADVSITDSSPAPPDKDETSDSVKEPVEEDVEEEEPVEQAEDGQIPDDTSESHSDYDLSLFEQRYKSAKTVMNATTTYDKKRQLVLDAIDAFKREQSTENLQLAIDYTILLPKLPLESEFDIYGDDKILFTETIQPLFEFLPDETEKEKLQIYFVQKAIERSKETKYNLDISIAYRALELLSEESLQLEFLNEIKEVEKDMMLGQCDEMLQSGFVNWDSPCVEFGEPPQPGEEIDNWEPGYDPNKNPYPTHPNENFTEGYSNIKFSYEGGVCYKTTTFYSVNGKLLKKVKDVAKGAEKNFCGIEIPDRDYVNKYYSNKNWNKAYVGSFDGKTDRASANNSGKKEAKTENKVPETTIQYTFEKDKDSPYYYDTGIPVGKDGTITYQQARDALYQIAIQAKGKFVEDTDRALALLDGLIILVEDKGKPIPIEDFIALFKDTSIGVKVQGSRSGFTYDLIDLVEIRNVSYVLVNGQKVELESSPIIDDSNVLFPIDNIAKAFGGTTSKTANSTIVVHKDNRIVFTDNKLTVVENGQVKTLKVATRQNQKGIRMVEAQALLDFFHATVEVQSETNEVVIKN